MPLLSTDTSFSDYLTTSNASVNTSGAVGTAPEYNNNVQGTIAQSSDSLAMAISGQGFFPVSNPITTADGQTSFSPTQYYTRAGDFQLNSDGYLVNSAGDYLDGWAVDPSTGAVRIEAPTWRGIVLTRTLVASEQRLGEIEQARRRFSCEPLS